MLFTLVDLKLKYASIHKKKKKKIQNGKAEKENSFFFLSGLALEKISSRERKRCIDSSVIC